MPRAAAAVFEYYLLWDDSSSNITDLSYMNHKPAGVSGPVAAGSDGRLYINSGSERIRFLAVNVTSSSCFPQKDKAPL
ncbi:MAG TPA: hypothetical protein ENN55_04265, partial [Firmicutes bacterium]|nr:hypothetical protein [Bacillota bacterium]